MVHPFTYVLPMSLPLLFSWLVDRKPETAFVLINILYTIVENGNSGKPGFKRYKTAGHFNVDVYLQDDFDDKVCYLSLDG